MAKTDRPSLDPIFRPRSVAVIGASRRPHTIGREILANLAGFEFTGPVYPVNPGATSIHSIPCYPSIGAIPGPVDLAIVTVPKEKVLEVVHACGRKKVGGLVVITAGFKEIGGDGRSLEAALKAAVRKYRMRMVGPNCMGVVNTEENVRLNATFAATVPVRGNVGFVSQSGALGEAILADAADNGLGVAMFVSMGNKTDVSGNDLLEYWEDNPDVQAILMYLESFGNPRRFTTIARRITRKKPIVAVKAGRTARGAQAASSHTGSIVALDTATDTLLEQCGVLRVSSMEEMISLAQALANQPVPKGGRIAIVTNAGGPGILCTDALIGAGLTLAELAPKTRKALAKALPPEASTANPVDMIASADAARYRAALDLVKKDPGVDGIVAIFVSPIMIDAYEVAGAIAMAADGTKPVLSVFMGKQRSAEGVAWLRDRRVPVYRFPEDAAAAMVGLARYRELRDRPAGKTVRYKAEPRRAKKAIATARRAGRTMLAADEVREVLTAYGLALAPSALASSAGEAIDAAQEFGYPVVLKASSARISHKSDVGGVKVDLRNADEVGQAYRDLVGRLRKADPKIRVQVQPMITGGRETILGMTRDPQFGPVLMFGLGGIFVEVMKDVAIRIHPLTDVTARGMIERIKGFPLLAGARGDVPVDLAFLEESLLRLSQLVGDLEDDLAELDLNPLIVTSDRKRSFIVDARIALTAKS
ncbi:MAG TPA: acetate--CoA ligase family protein [Candidatus Polarisedimenticolaceae bacterium]|nr:acetate--CoA ligase family protein [Candidatus Polarisedimenticolaceae bacterium]